VLELNLTPFGFDLILVGPRPLSRRPRTGVFGVALVSPWSHPNDHMRAVINWLVQLAVAANMGNHTTLLLRYSVPSGYLEAHPSDKRWLRALAIAQPAEVVASAWEACLTCDLHGVVRAIRAPSLIIAGRSDLFTPPYPARAVARELADVEIEVWEETGHFPFLEHPRRFNQRVEEFIRRCLAQAGSA
jgi:pimeloyl-ACP methyl ester carboxylesterase